MIYSRWGAKYWNYSKYHSSDEGTVLLSTSSHLCECILASPQFCFCPWSLRPPAGDIWDHCVVFVERVETKLVYSEVCSGEPLSCCPICCFLSHDDFCSQTLDPRWCFLVWPVFECKHWYSDMSGCMLGMSEAWRSKNEVAHFSTFHWKGLFEFCTFAKVLHSGCLFPLNNQVILTQKRK